MNRQEFILALRSELRKLPPEEIVAATEFFEEYIDEVLTNGEKTEQEIIKELGSPKRVAAEIKADYAARLLDGQAQPAGKGSGKGEKGTTGKISAVWWVVIGICSAPVSIPIACCVAAVAFCVIITVLSVMISIYAAIIGCAVAAVSVIVLGIVSFAASGATGFMCLGAGLALAALTAAAGVAAFIGTKELVKWIVRMIKDAHQKRKNKKLAQMSEAAGADWAFTEEPKDPRDGFINGGMIQGGEHNE